MTQQLDVSAQLAGGMRFEVETGSGYALRLDMAREEGGEGAGAQPMEMLLVGLAGCAGMSNLLLLRRRGQDVHSYEIRIHGVRAGAHPQVFTQITVEHLISGVQIRPEEVERALRLTEQKYCGASAMLEQKARISHTWRLIAVQGRPANHQEKR
jgi:putative redox protein